MKRAAFFLLAAIIPAFGQYSYYYTDALTSSNSNWTHNGSTGSYTSSGFTSTSASTLVADSNIPPPANDSQTSYEVKMTLALTQSGGTFSALLRASPNASLTASSSTGTFYAIEITNIVFSGSTCSATLASYKVINGTATNLSSGAAPCGNGMIVRSVITTSGVVYVYINNELSLALADSSITSGSPGISVVSSPSGNTISQVQLGPLDTVAPNAIVANTVATSSFPTRVDFQWQGVTDVQPGGVGVYEYSVLRELQGSNNYVYIGSSFTSDFSDTTVSPFTGYNYALQVSDFHGNSSWTIISVATPPAGNIDPREIGVRSLGSYWGDGAEQIDMRSGNLNYSIPLIKPIARGWSASFNLTYNSQNWREDAAPWKLGEDVGYGFGWQLLAGSLTPIYNGLFTVSYYLFTDATGAQYRLNQNSSGVWSSLESVYVWYDSNVGRLYFRDGSFWVFGCTSAGTEQDAGVMYPTLMEDTNGNQLTITYQAGAGVSWTNSSARIVNILDTRGAGGNTYTFSYSNSHLSSITNSIGTAEAYTFTYNSVGNLVDPFFGWSYGETNSLASMQQTPTSMTTQFTYDTSAQMTLMKTQYGGSLQWSYSQTNPPYSGSRYLMEVSSRQLVKQTGATATTYPITYGAITYSPIAAVHPSGMVQDPGGSGQKLWTFDTTSTDAQVGLATSYNARVQYGTNTGGQELDYTWSTNASGNLYTSKTVTTQDVAMSSAIAKYTTQTQDQYGNVTQVQVSNWGQSQVVRTYTNTYLNSSGYTSAHIVNRLTGSSVTDGTNSSTLSTISYDSDSLGGVLAATPGITAHDSAYACNYGTNGCTTYYRGNPTTISQPGNYTTLQHDLAGNVVFSDANGVTTWPTIGSAMNYTVPSAITTGSFTTNLGFSSFLGLTSETGPNGDSLGIGYDAAARPSTTTSPYGSTTAYTYNDNPTPPALPTHIAITGAANGSHGTRTTLDGFGRTIKVETGTGTATNFTVVSTVDSIYGSCGCSPLGKLTQTSMPYAPGGTEVYTTYAYDGMGRTMTQTAPDGSVTTYAYAGNSVSVKDPAGKWKQYYMDSLGNVSLVVEPNPDTNPTSPPAWSYATYTQNPPLSNVTYHQTSYAYDVLNHLILVTMPRYNASSQTTTTQTRTFNYTTSNQVGALLLSATNPENGTVTYTYGANNMIATKLDANNQKTVYSYDSYNRVTEIQHFFYQAPFGPYTEDTSQQVLYSYDTNPYDTSGYSTYASGRLTAIKYQPKSNTFQQPMMQEWYAYSAAGSVTGKQLRVSQQNPAGQGYPANTGMVALTSSYVYDNEGKMTSVTYPSVSNYSATFTTTYDGMSRPFGLSDQGNDFIVNNVTYGPSNELLTMGYANCVGCQPYIENRSYNSRLQLTSIGALQYIYPTNGMNNGKAIEQKVTSGEDVVYSYDALNRLILAQTTTGSSTTWGQSFTYDGFGNLYQKTPTQGSAPAMSATVNAATNQLSLGNYDGNGNLYEIPGVNGGNPTYYAIDMENRMVSVNTTGSPAGIATYWYGYDPGNRRVWKGTYDSNGNLTAQEAYFYSPSGQKLGTYSLTLNNYPPSNDVAVATDIQVFFGAKRVGNSEPGSPQIIVAVTQDRVGSFGTYYPYGEDKGTPLLPNDQLKFATYTRDSASGLDYAMNRYYSSTWGRFSTPDPVGADAVVLSDPTSWNLYSYAGNDPINFNDPDGTTACGDLVLQGSGQTLRSLVTGGGSVALLSDLVWAESNHTWAIQGTAAYFNEMDAIAWTVINRQSILDGYLSIAGYPVPSTLGWGPNGATISQIIGWAGQFSTITGGPNNPTLTSALQSTLTSVLNGSPSGADELDFYFPGLGPISMTHECYDVWQSYVTASSAIGRTGISTDPFASMGYTTSFHYGTSTTPLEGFFGSFGDPTNFFGIASAKVTANPTPVLPRPRPPKPTRPGRRALP